MRSCLLDPRSAVLAVLLVATGCSQAPDTERSATADSAEAASEQAASAVEHADAGSAPGFTTSAAPGVAFAYSYAFTLPGDAISDVQHRHAAACEELGAARCQITGMDFRQDSSGSVSARLDFLVAPAIAHRFGKQALDAVREADGALDHAEVTGDDVGRQIDASQLRSAGLEAELARIEQRLAMAGLGTQERASLLSRAQELRASLRGEQDSRAEGETRLATTPMSFAYASKGLFAASDDPLGDATAHSLGSLESMLAVMLTLFGLAAPWLLLAGLLFLAWRGLARRAVPAAIEGGEPQG